MMDETLKLEKPMNGVMHFNIDLDAQIKNYCKNFKEKFLYTFSEDELFLKDIFKGTILEDIQKYNEMVLKTKTYSFKRHLIESKSADKK